MFSGSFGIRSIVLCKCSGKYIDIYFNLKIKFLAPSEQQLCVASPYFRALPIEYGSKVTGVYDSFL